MILFTPSVFARHFSFQSTSIHSALGDAFSVDVLHKLTFYLLTYLLTYYSLLSNNCTLQVANEL